MTFDDAVATAFCRVIGVAEIALFPDRIGVHATDDKR